MRVVVVQPDPSWPARFGRFARGVHEALGDVAVAVHHIGSTSIPGIHAKPIIDILVEATSLDALDDRAEAMVDAGYESLGEFGIPGRRYYRMDDETGTRVCQVHAFEAGSPGANRHLAFRDFMRSHPDLAREYSELKVRLAGRNLDIEAYMDGKDSFIKEMERQALRWWSDGSRPAPSG
ncbi:MAG: GrpB family protein [Candidatus Eisenbacteria bacterium]